MQDMGYRKWDMGNGIWDMAYGIWDVGYGMLPRSKPLCLCEQCHGTACWLSLPLWREEGEALDHA